MSVPAPLASLVGRWTGPSALWLEPGSPARTSASTATVELVGNGRFLSVRYTWSFDEKPQEGLLLVGQESGGEAGPGVVRASWIDSWHNGDKIMVCTGTATAAGAVDVKGAYAAPPGPDWGWRTTLEATSEGALKMVMFNVEPDGTEALAVDMTLQRA